MHPERIGERLTGGQTVGIALARTQHGNLHVGIVYVWRGQEYFYHQAFHVDTRHETLDAGMASLGGAALVVGTPLARDRQKAIAGFLNSLSKINPQFPYSLRYDPQARIDRTLGRLVTDDGRGLSCVTFVLAVFRSLQVRVVEAATWPHDRAEDLTAQQELIDFVSRHPLATPEHLAAIRAERGSPRIRPEELAAAGCWDFWPVAFDWIQPVSLDLLARLAAPSGP